jgi:hypothetical protein
MGVIRFVIPVDKTDETLQFLTLKVGHVLCPETPDNYPKEDNLIY